MIVYVKKSKESAENHPRNNDYSNTVGKVNIQNSITFLYIYNELTSPALSYPLNSGG